MALTDERFAARHTLRLGGTRYGAGDVIEGSEFNDDEHVQRYLKNGHIELLGLGEDGGTLAFFDGTGIDGTDTPTTAAELADIMVDLGIIASHTIS